MVESRRTARRKPWLAGLLSAGQLGLGQLYNGQPKKAIFLAVFPLLVGIPILLMLLIYAPLGPPYNVFLAALLLLSIIVAIVWDAIRVAKQQGPNYEMHSYNKWYVYVAFCAICAFVIDPMIKNNILRENVAQAFKIPGGGMAPTLLGGDHILVNRSYVWSESPFQRGDIISFVYPEDETKVFVKRIIGLAGETIEIKDKIIYLNGTPLNDSKYTVHLDPGSIKGSVSPRDNFGPVRVPDESYFVLGDDRDRSLDSRFFGFVSHSRIVGKVFFIYWSWDEGDWRVRWDRIGLRF